MYRSWRQRVYSGTLRPPRTAMEDTKTSLINTLTELMVLDNRPNANRGVSIIEPGLYLGDGFAAMDLKFLEKEGFTHVLNMAEGYGPGCVNTNASYYRRTNIKYKGFNAYDRPSFPLETFFPDAIKFIQQAMDAKGKILVHCVMGISRSASVVMAYFIVTKKIRASQALRYVYQKRIVQPNDGFMEQLARFSNMQARYW
ncbi:uncharacterized protein CBL_13798 [Carabus blaptoides fortunei]